MPDFEAKIRCDYRDIGGLILDLRHDGIASDGSLWTNAAPPARALDTGSHTSSTGTTLFDYRKNWRENVLIGKTLFNVSSGASGIVTANDDQSVTAVMSGGSRSTWMNGDAYALTTMRFGNAVQPNENRRPTWVISGGYNAASFDRSAAQYMELEIPYDQAAGKLTPMIEVAEVNGSDNSQDLLSMSTFSARARNSSGNMEYRCNSTTQAVSGAMDEGIWLINPTSASAADVLQNNVEVLGDGDYEEMELDAGPSFLGCVGGVSNFLDAKLRHVAIWNRGLSLLEVDFAHHTFSPVIQLNEEPRMTITPTRWTDDTSDEKVSRLNSRTHASAIFYLASGAADSRVQLSASVNGFVLPDSELDSRLFTWDCAEYPAPPTFHRDSGWSAICDIALPASGHYTFVCIRESGGSHVLHLDVEVTL